MRVDWYGQAAFHLSGREGLVFIDPIGDTAGLAFARREPGPDRAAGNHEVRFVRAGRQREQEQERAWIHVGKRYRFRT